VATTSYFVIGVAYGSVWLADADGGVVTRVDAKSLQVVAAIALPGYGTNGAQPGGGNLSGGYFAFEAGYAWVTGPHELFRIDPGTNRATSYDIGIEALSEWGDVCIAAGRGTVWVRTTDTEVVRVDPQTGKVVSRYPAAGGGGCIAVGFKSLWVVNFIDSTVWRIPLDD
jgi:streptogramin lyase